jgi:hypothetical protein
MNASGFSVKNESRIIFVWFLILLIIINMFIVIPPVQGIYKTTFTDGNSEKIITFPTGGGIDDSLNISVRYGAAIKSAQLKLTGLTMGGEYLSNVYLDVGADTDYEWAFAGVGYGKLGHQTIFNDSTSIINGYLQNSPFQISNEIKIPKSATINSAQLNISGSVHEFVNAMRIDSTLGTVYNCELGDVDGDNDLDGIVAYRSEISPYPTVLIWCNNTLGDGSSWTNHVIANTGFTYPYGLAVGDLDGDNDLDVVVSDNTWTSRDILWYNNTLGNGSSWTVHTIRSSIPGTSVWIYNLALADMNNDSYIDVVGTLSNNDGNQEDIYWYSNVNGDGQTWSLNKINETIIGARGISVGDIDGDGDNDTAITVIPTSGTDQVWWFSNNNGVGTSWTRYLINNTLSDPFNVVIADIDNDTNPDLTVIGGANTVWFEAPGNPTVVSNWKIHNIGVGGGWGGDIAVVDIGYNYTNKEPDNNLDIIIVCRSSDDVIIYKNDGTPIDGGWVRINLNTNHDSANWMAVGDINGDNYIDTLAASSLWTTTIDDLIWYQYNGGVPTNVELYLGSDAQADWVEPDILDYKTKIPDFTINLTQYINQLSSYFDDYGNEFVSIPLTVTTATPGRIIISDLDIEYDFTATVNMNPHGNLATELTEALANIPPDNEGNSTVPFKFISGSGGQLRIHDLSIEYNEFPWFTQSLPSTLSSPEDSISTDLLDLRGYVADDYIEVDDLIFNISYTTGPGSEKVTVKIYNNYFIGVDALTGSQNDNWTGYVDFIVNVTDNFGSATESEFIRLAIQPVNDEPILGPAVYSDIILTEGATSKSVDLDAKSYFIDVYEDELYYSIALDPGDRFSHKNLTFDLDPSTNKVTFTAHGDWFGDELPVRIFCDDSIPVNTTLYQDFAITVINLNDPPAWKDIPDLIIDEDEVLLNALNLSQYIIDPDDVPENITFGLVSNSNFESIGISVNENKFVDIHPLIPEYTGSTIVTLRATDPGQNYSDASFKVTYQPVNDAPAINLISPAHNSMLPSERVILTWEGSDIDTPLENLTYSVFFGDTLTPPKLDFATNLMENHFIISGLQDEGVYYWRVLVDDGDEKLTLSEVSSFIVDLSTQPRIKLLSPDHDAIFPETYVAFDWEVVFTGGHELTYDFYLDTNEDPLENGLNSSGLTKTELKLYDLAPGQTYYWTVIPRFESGFGISENGVFKFTIDPSKIAYGLKVRPLETELSVYKGETYTFEVEFLNLGPRDEIIHLTILPKNLSYSIDILHGKDVTIDAEGSRSIEFTIDTSNIVEGDYIITIVATSEKTPAVDQDNLTLEVLEKKGKDTGLFKSLTDYIPIIIIILIALVGFILIYRYKPKEDKRFEEREEERLGKGLGARGTEILYKPPREAVAGLGWQPQVPAGMEAPYLDTTEEQVPQLPAPGVDLVSEPSEESAPIPSVDTETEPEPALEEVPEFMLPEDLEEPHEPVSGEPIPSPEFGEPLKLETMPADEVVPEVESPEVEQDVDFDKLGILPEEKTTETKSAESDETDQRGLTPDKQKSTESNSSEEDK